LLKYFATSEASRQPHRAVVVQIVARPAAAHSELEEEAKKNGMQFTKTIETD
jgi:hypothetical protein